MVGRPRARLSRMLLQLLKKPRLLVHERASLGWMLARPWCWPADDALAARAAELGFVPPRDPMLGETALVTVSEGRTRSSLYRFGPRTVAASAVPLSASAQRALDRMNLLVSRALGALRPNELARRHQWSVELLARDGEGVDTVVDGPSFGLGMGLAMASLFLRRPVPATVLASAEVDAEGGVSPIGGIDLKLANVAENALGVRRVLVAAAQLGEASRALAGLPRPLEVIGVSTLQDALAAGLDFTFDADDLRALFEDSNVANEVAGRLFDMVVDGSRVALDWQAVQHIAEAVHGRLDDGPGLDERKLQARERVVIARAIARRHAGYGDLLPWPREGALGAMPRPRRLRLLAHLVQSAAEWSDEDARTYAQRAATALAPRQEQTEGDLVLLGAIGRALASVETDAEALEALEAALAGWWELGAHADASFALAECIRVVGLSRDVARLERLTADVVPLVIADPRTTEVGAAHVAFAAGRGNLLANRPEEAMVWLTSAGAVDWQEAPRWLARSRARWLARARQATGDSNGAAAERAALEQAARFGEDDEHVLLARLDGAVAASEGAEPLLLALSAHPRAGRETTRILTRRAGLAPPDRAAALADRYRY